MEEPYYTDNDYETGYRNGVCDATGGLGYEIMTVKGFGYQKGYKEGWNWAKFQMIDVEGPGE